MTEVEMFAQAGERAGAALDSGVQTARKARDATQTALSEGWNAAQEVFADRLYEARRELAARIEPGPARPRRWPWLILVFLVIAGAVSAVVLTRRPQQIEPDSLPIRPGREPGSGDSDPDAIGNPDPLTHPAATGGSPMSNGMVGVERPSAGTD